jgi:hypothetical protein
MRTGVAILAVLAGVLTAGSALACTPMKAALYFQPSSDAMREGQTNALALVDAWATRGDLSTLDLYSYTNVDLEPDDALDLANRRLDVVRAHLLEAGFNATQLRLKPVGAAGVRTTTDPLLSNHVLIVPTFLRDGMLVDGCGTSLNQPAEGNP